MVLAIIHIHSSIHNTRNGVTYKGSYDFANIETDYGIKAKFEKDKRALEASAGIKGKGLCFWRIWGSICGSGSRSGIFRDSRFNLC